MTAIARRLGGFVSRPFISVWDGELPHQVLSLTKLWPILLCICMPYLAALNCLVDGLGKTGKQKLTVYIHTPNKANLSVYCVP